MLCNISEGIASNGCQSKVFGVRLRDMKYIVPQVVCLLLAVHTAVNSCLRNSLYDAIVYPVVNKHS